MASETHQDANLTASPTVDAAHLLARHTPMRSCGLACCRWGDHDVLICAECKKYWRGDGETGGCESVLLARENSALRANVAYFKGAYEKVVEQVRQLESAHARAALLEGLLRSVEWVNTADGETLYCPRCGWSEQEGHAPRACALGATLHPRVADGGEGS